MKRLLLYTALCVCVCACKKQVSPVTQTDPNEVMVKATRLLDGQQSLSSSRASLPDEFGEGSSVGLYTRLSNQSVFLQSNSRYSYNLPTWSPAVKEEKLLYDATNNPIYIYGYHPHNLVVGTSTSVDPTDLTKVDFQIKRNQSTLDSLQLSDLMWVAAKGIDASGQPTTTGYTRNGKPVMLPFKHKLCKITFKLKIVDTKPEVGSPTEVTLKKIIIKSKDFATKAQLNVMTGVLTPQTKNVVDSVFWKAPGDGIILQVNDDAVEITDLVVVPFVVKTDNSSFNFIFDVNGTQLAFQKKLEAYTGKPDIAIPDGNMMRFAENDYHRFTVTVDVSNSYVVLEAKILPWSDLPGVDLETNRD